ncbi:MAG: NAD+ synthase [Deltaproteobacteria bacterium]|nr:NAD+ synthase [Deltaproteobacteria bacterium]MBI3293911.1 NAD+ synthase [Deltaproteobacteria bacterium]
MNVVVAQINPQVGNIEKNTERILKAVNEAQSLKAQLLIFPELAMVGYPPRDLVYSPSLRKRQDAGLAQIRATLGDMTAIIGCLTANPHHFGRPLRNSAAVLHARQETRYYHKQLLPTYDVFDEERYFEPGLEPLIWNLNGSQVGVTICEDIWNFDGFRERHYRRQPLEGYRDRGLSLLVNLSSSPYRKGRPQARIDLLARVSQVVKCPVVYCNQVGGNDELVFDGCSLVTDSIGRVTTQGPAFEEAVFSAMTTPSSWPQRPIEWTRDALSLGLKDFLKKNGASRVVLGISGGIDSSVVAALATRALGPDAVLGVMMPSQFTSSASREDSKTLASQLKIRTVEVPIDDSIATLSKSLSAGVEQPLNELAQENLQPRVRMAILMAIANQEGRFLLNTSNKSELATGYSTQYGDGAGALSVIGDLVKEEVYQLGEDLNRWCPAIPPRVFTRAPTAELKPNQTDQDRLPPYPILDQMVRQVLEEGIDFDSLTGFEEKWIRTFRDLYRESEFKRRQFPPILRVTRNAFGIGRRIPLAAQID